MLCFRLIAHLCVTFLPLALAHSRWSCPEPRSPDTGIKEGPCGDDTDNFDDIGSLLQLTPGPLLVTFEESIHHTGAPFRISLSGKSSTSAHLFSVIVCMLVCIQPFYSTFNII